MTGAAKCFSLLFAFLFALFAPIGPSFAQYKVEGFVLGDEIRPQDAKYRTYTCKPSEDFAGITWCQRTQTRSSGGLFSSSLAHTRERIAVYVMANIGPVSGSKSAIETEIQTLSRENNEQPTAVNWFSRGQNLPTAVIARWGEIELEELKQDALAIVAAGESPHMGVLVDALGDLKRSAENGFPVYRITGGPGYLYAASFDSSGRGHRHYVAINGSELVVNQGEAALRAILRRDQARARDDYSLWPDVARIARRLARETSTANANDFLDKVFDSAPSKKLRSHVWPLLPGGTIEHLAVHQFGLIDIYGPKTSYPDIRQAMQKFIAANPSEPFIEFLHYTLGDFDRARAANPNSPIKDVVDGRKRMAAHPCIVLPPERSSPGID